MPGLAQKAFRSRHSSPAADPHQSGSAANSRTGIWSRSNANDADLPRLHKFWSELPSAARHELLRIDKQTLFEQVRKNLYCSRCNGLLLEGYSQIFQYNKNLQEGVGSSSSTLGCNRNIYNRGSKIATIGTQDDARDPAVHPWGGLAATRDNMLTLLDCFLDDQPLEVIQNVFDCARAREWERELLYPDACGGGGRGWFSQGGGNSGLGRGHYFKETCALHTATLSCEALVDFWSALGEETRKSLLRMKEEDFIERLMFRFDRKQFCRDCRRNVLKEFKELKELKRTRREPRCTRSFCTPDTAFRYEVSDSSVQIDWKECFAGELGRIYHHFEWGIGSSEGKSDIFSFEDVGLCEGARIDGLDFTNFSACFITLRAWKCDGRCTELSVKAHALKGQLCVHRRLVIGDGYVSITKGDTIKCFFEHAEETEEEEDDDDDNDDAMDKDGSDPDNDGSRLQKHAKSPELAREFLLDAANVIFKEQVEKAFREGTARQNAHSIFICLALNLLEDRIHVACKEITSLEKQNKLLEEEEVEKHEEEERRERKKLKEKERKLRRKAKLKSKEQDEETNKETEISSTIPSGCSIRKDETLSLDEEENYDDINGLLSQPSSPDMIEAMQVASVNASNKEINRVHGHTLPMDDIEDTWSSGDANGIFIVEQSKAARRRSKMRKGPFVETVSKRLSRRSPLRVIETGLHPRNSIQMSTTSVIDLTTKTSCSSQYKTERNVVPKWIEVCNRHSQHRQEHQHCLFPNLDNPTRFKARQNHIYQVGRDFGSNKKIERSHKALIGTKYSHRLGNAVPRPLQTKLEVMQHSGPNVSCAVKKGDAGEQLVTHSVTSYKTIKDVVTSPQLMVTDSASGSLMFSKDPSDSESSKMPWINEENLITVYHGMPPPLEISSVCLEGQGVQSASSLIAVDTPLPPSYDVGSGGSASCQDPESFIYKRSDCRSEVFSDGAPYVDSCSYSATSCITDSSDSSAIDNMISETTFCSEVISSLPEGEMITQSSFMTENLSDFYKKENSIIERNLEVPVSFKAVRETTPPGNPLKETNISTSEFSGFSNMPEHANGLPNNHGPDAANSNYSPVDMVSSFYHLAFPMQILGTPSSLLPLLPPRHFGHYQVQEQWATAVSAHLLPFPLPSGLDLSTDGLTTPSHPLPSPFQTYPTLMGLGRLPDISTDLSFIQQESHVLSGIGQTDVTESRYADGLEYLCSETVMTGNKSFSAEYSISMDAACDSIPSELKGNALEASNLNGSGFSFFHFGGPTSTRLEEQELSVPGTHEDVGDDLQIPNMPCRSLQVAKMAIPVEEYNLFAAAPGNIFGFF